MLRVFIRKLFIIKTNYFYRAKTCAYFDLMEQSFDNLFHMSRIRRIIKRFFIVTNTLSILNKFNYLYAYCRNYIRNRAFKRINRDFNLPPDYYLYESYQLNYRQYKEDGQITASEVINWTSQYLLGPLNILEWGCGVSRVVRHIPDYVCEYSKVYGVDINKQMIDWNSKHISNVIFSINEYNPPTKFNDNHLCLVFALSVFTHIGYQVQSKWIKEIYRIIKTDGVFLFTTHGKNYDKNLTNKQVRELDVDGSITVGYKKKGHRMMSTYNRYSNFRELVETYFSILEYYDGGDYPDKVGGQDLWIVKKI